MGSVLSRPICCSKDFPDECKECSEYEEVYPTLDVALTGCFGLYAAASYTVKRCRRFNWKSYERT